MNTNSKYSGKKLKIGKKPFLLLAQVEKLVYSQKENAIECNVNTFCKLIMTYIRNLTVNTGFTPDREASESAAGALQPESGRDHLPRAPLPSVQAISENLINIFT